MAHDIFISYAAEDKRIADAVCQAIEAQGIQCWYAPRDVSYGQDFEESIVDAIGASRLIILILTSHSNTSAHVKREIQNACLEQVSVPVLPFRVEDIALNKALRYYIGSVHWFDAVTSPLEPHLQRLVEHVRARLPHVVEPTPAKEPDIEMETTPSETETAVQLSTKEEETDRKRTQSGARSDRVAAGSKDQTPADSAKLTTQQSVQRPKSRRRSPAPARRSSISDRVSSSDPKEKTALKPDEEKLEAETEPKPPPPFPETVRTITLLSRTSGLWAVLALPVAAVLLLLVIVGGVVGLYLYKRSRTEAEMLPNKFTFQTVKLDTNGNVITRKSGTARYFTEDLGNGVTLDMVQIPAGRFLMGSPEAESTNNEERPQHQVAVPAFFIGKYEITQAQWRAVSLLPKIKIDLNPNQSHWKGDSLPADEVWFSHAVEFCARLSKKTGRTYRLPTEAEWEYACRAGTTTPFAFGGTITLDIVNYDGDYPYGGAPKQGERHTTVAVGSLGVANEFGLYDMHGNVVEWCLDGPHPGYVGAPADGTAWNGSEGPDSEWHIMRGGGLGTGSNCRCGRRDNTCGSCASGTIGYYKGFRVVATAAP